MAGPETLEEGDLVLLRHRGGDSVLIRLRRGPHPVEGRGVIDLTSVIGHAAGERVSWAGAEYEAVRPTLPDLLAGLRRKAQIVTPKDAQHLLYLAGVGPGLTVGEAGAGSGALTTVLAHAVGPTGAVVAFDRRRDHLEVARRNLDGAGLAERVRFVERDVAANGFGELRFDAVVLDLPEPWAVLPAVRDALVPGGRVATYTPTYNQLEHTVRQLRELKFDEVRSVELLERALHVGDGGTRPEFEMLGHTGFLTGARRGIGPWS
jgi:tRNA (adenine57-N1/adenine58-N1)-methyltransferase catalytic subunit